MNSLLASGSFGVTFALVFTICCTVGFVIFAVCFWWVDVKKRPLREMGIRIRKGIWSMFEKVYEFFHYNSTVKTVYSDKSMNYSGTEFLPIPTKAPTNQYTYEFVGWDKNGVDEKGNIVVRAIYLQKVTRCYINVFDDDKTTLLYSTSVEYGAGVNLSELKPTKPESKEFSYKFVGWDKDINAFYKNENIYAVYNAVPKKYTYKFLDEDGETVLSQGTAIYGTPIIAPKTPKRATNDNGVSEFAQWKYYVDGMLLTKDCEFIAEYRLKPLGEVGSASIIKTEGEKIKVIPETKLTANEDSAHEEIKKQQVLNTIKFDATREPETSITEIKVPAAGGVIRKKQGMLVQRNIEQDEVEKFREINSSESQTHEDKEVHQKIQLMAIKKSTETKSAGSNVIKIKPKPEKAPEDDELLKNMMVNKIKIDKKDDE